MSTQAAPTRERCPNEKAVHHDPPGQSGGGRGHSGQKTGPDFLSGQGSAQEGLK